VLTVDGLLTFYGRAQVLFDVALEVGRGEVVALLGRNGAGKSTTLKSIIGLVRPAAGTVIHDGVDVTGADPHRICRRGLGYVPEERRIFTGLSVAENLEVGRQPPRPGVPEWTPERVYALFPNLGEIRERPGGRISGGEQQMLTIARTLMGNPATILLDEPSEGLAPKIIDEMALMIGDLKAEGLTVLLAEQNMRFATRVADRVHVLETGYVRWHGTTAAFIADDAAQRRFLMA
jgi:branched-chain amino acid transport system ATP-binding protein